MQHFEYKIPLSGAYYWTKHSLAKMAFYGLSESRVKRILRFPQRTEKGIAPETIASMQTSGSKKHPYEIWVMYQIKNQIRQQADKVKSANWRTKSNPPAGGKNRNQQTIKQIIIISAWKYPGITKPGEPIPIPQDILEEILKNYI